MTVTKEKYVMNLRWNQGGHKQSFKRSENVVTKCMKFSKLLN